MNKTTKLLGLAVVLMGMTLVGCQKSIELTFYNHTDVTLPVTVTTPEQGTMNVGSIPGNDGMLIYTITVKKDILPANCSATVGSALQPFTVTDAMKDKQWFHLTADGLAGPMSRKAGINVIRQTGEVQTTGGTRMIVD